MDQLYKDIIFYDAKNETGLQIGGWWRGLGFKGGKVDDVVVYNRTLTPFEIKILANKATWQAIVEKPVASLSQEERAVLKDYYVSVSYTHLDVYKKQQ